MPTTPGVDGAVLFADIMLPLDGMGVPYDPAGRWAGDRIPDPRRRRGRRPAGGRSSGGDALRGGAFVARRAWWPPLGFAGAVYAACYLVDGRRPRSTRNQGDDTASRSCGTG